MSGTHIVLTSISGCRNRGVEALVRSTLDGFRAADPRTEFTLLSTDPEYDGWVFGDRATVLPDAARIFRGGLTARVAAGLSRYHRRIGRSYRDVLAVYRNSDLVVATGGDVFSSDYGHGLLRRSLGMLSAAQDRGVPTMFLAQSIGPFKTQAELAAWRRVAEKAALITVREDRSYDYVTQVAGLPQDRVRLTADPAFLLSPSSSERVDDLWRGLGLEPDVPTVALAPSRGITRFAGIDARAHAQRWAECIGFIIEELGAQVLLVPHVHDVRLANDDRVLASELLDASRFRDGLRVAHGELRAGDFKGLIARCDMVVGERMHACIAGLSSGTCTVAVGYSVKAEGIMGQLLGDAVTDGVAMSVADFVTRDDTLERLVAVWRRRDVVATTVRTRLPEIKQSAASAFDLALAVT